MPSLPHEPGTNRWTTFTTSKDGGVEYWLVVFDNDFDEEKVWRLIIVNLDNCAPWKQELVSPGE